MNEVEVAKAKSAVALSGSRAATLLEILLNGGDFPVCHISHAREIVREHKAATDAWKRAIGIKEVARG